MSPTDRRRFLAQTAGALVGVALLPELSMARPPARRSGSPTPVGLVGAGRQGRAILDELDKLDAVEVAAVCDVVPSRAEAAAGRAAAGAGVFTDHRDLLDRRPDVEAVFVATPTHLHRDVALDCLGAGRHVYCEAPLAATEEDCRAMVAAAAASTRVFQTGFLARSNPIYRRAFPLARSDSVREHVSAYAQHNRKTSWRFPAPSRELERAFDWRLDPDVSIGLAGELGSHQFDVFQWIRGRDPVSVRGHGALRLHHDGRTLPDTVQVELVWDDGVRLQYHASLASSYGGQYEVLHGAAASLRLAWSHGWMFKEADAATQGWEVYAVRQQFFEGEGIVLIADATQLAAQERLQDGIGLEHPSLHYAVADFIRSVNEGAPVACTAEDGLRATVAGILANRAVLEARELEIAI